MENLLFDDGEGGTMMNILCYVETFTCHVVFGIFVFSIDYLFSYFSLALAQATCTKGTLFLAEPPAAYTRSAT